MRITGGIAKGIPILTPKSNLTRPATDALRQAIFSSLGPIPENTSILDLFAGTGAYGLEALSRGASHATFIELHAQTLSILSKNILTVTKSLQINPKTHTKPIRADALKFPLPTSQKFDLIFIDPPYSITESALPIILENIPKYLNPLAKIILELPSHLPNPSHPLLIHTKKLGKSSKNTPSAHFLKLA